LQVARDMLHVTQNRGTRHIHISHVIHYPSHTTRDMSSVRFSLSLQTVDLAQFFQDKLDTVEWLLAKKYAATNESKQHNRMQRGGEDAFSAATVGENQRLPVVDLLHSIDRAHLEGFYDDFKVILRRLEVVKTQIQTIKQSFEARLASKSSEDQANLNTSINWMTRLSIVVMPMNLIAGFFGMNVPVPWNGESRFFF
jgi:Mg2+ and Co2+ transporter CorA